MLPSLTPASGSPVATLAGDAGGGSGAAAGGGGISGGGGGSGAGGGEGAGAGPGEAAAGGGCLAAPGGTGICANAAVENSEIRATAEHLVVVFMRRHVTTRLLQDRGVKVKTRETQVFT